MDITLTPIGTAHTQSTSLPRHWSLSDVQGTLDIDPAYEKGLRDIQAGQRIVVLFHFHKSQSFSPGLLTQNPPHKDRPYGVFSICSPRRPNPIGLSILTVLEVKGSQIRVTNMDMLEIGRASCRERVCVGV